MNEFTKLRKAIRTKAISGGIIRRVAERTGFTKATISRTFAGRFDAPNPEIVAALRYDLVCSGLLPSDEPARAVMGRTTDCEKAKARLREFERMAGKDGR